MSEHTCVVLFADISGSMQLYGNLGDEGAKTLILELQQRLGSVITTAGGVVQEFIGDEVMARFDVSDNAAACAGVIHECAAEFSSEKDQPVQMRIGIHGGTAVFEQDRMFGDTVNVAARVASIAKGGQTITTEFVVNNLNPVLSATARQFDVTKIKGKEEPIVIYDLPGLRSDLTQIKVSPQKTRRGLLKLSFSGDDFTLDLGAAPYSLGRSVGNDLVVHGDSVSRRHATIEIVRNRFVVSDNSTNGTHVYLSNGEVIYLRREQLPLWGQGRLSLGAVEDEGINHVVEYDCQSG